MTCECGELMMPVVRWNGRRWQEYFRCYSCRAIAKH